MTLSGVFATTDGRLRAPWRIAAFLVVGAVVLSLVRSALVWLPVPRDAMNQMTRTWFAVLFVIATTHAVMLFLVDKTGWEAVGLGRSAATPRLLAAGLVLGAVGILLPSGALLLAHWLRPAPATLERGSALVFALRLALFFLPQSLAEEMLSRGYLFAAIRGAAGAAGAIWAVGLTALAFASLHLWNPGANAQSFSLVLLAGIFLGAIVAVTGSLWAAWLAHFAWNFSILAVLHAPVSGFTLPAPGYTVVDSGPVWATGGSWGPEGGAAAALGMCAMLAVLFAWHRRTLHAPATVAVHG